MAQRAMRRWTVQAAVAALALVLLSGCNNLIIGDSISDLSRGSLTADPRTIVDADAGRGAHQVGTAGLPDGWTTFLRRLPQVAAGQWLVVELGTNDLDRPAAEWSAFVNAVVDRLPNDRCLAWVTPYHWLYQRQSVQYERIVRAAIVRQPCRAVIHWDDLARNHPEVTLDGVHPNARGIAMLTCMVSAVLYAGCDRPYLVTRN